MMPFTEYFKQGCKPNQTGSIGLEVEHFLISRNDGRPMPYDGENGIGQLLEFLRKDFPHTYYEQDLLIALESEDVLITLEPGCQLEISLRCMNNLQEMMEIYLKTVSLILAYIHPRGYDLIYSGGLPTIGQEDVVLIDKERYRLMAQYFQNVSTRGLEMMKATAAVHVSVDYTDENDFIRKYRMANILHPLLAFLSSHTPVYAGKKNEDVLLRDSIWSHTDPARCGILPSLFEENFGFDAYARFLEQVPLIVMNDHGNFIDVKDQTCAQVAGIYGYGKTEIAHYLSMLFLDVRLKQFIEIRSADSMPPIYTQAYCALVKGLFYKQENIDTYSSLTNSIEDILQAKEALRKDCYDAIVYGKPVFDLLKEMISDAKKGLTEKEKSYLLPLEELVDTKSLIPNLSIEETYQKAILMHPMESKESALRITEAIQKSELNLGGNMYTRTLHIPKIFTQEDKHRFEKIVDTTYSIFTKVIQAYKTDAQIRKLFGFSRELEELILCEPAYTSPIPICRVDIFYDEQTKDFHFCEFNTDGTSAMNENKRLNDFLPFNNIFQHDPEDYEILELVQSWADAFIQTMKEDSKVCEKARIGICDFLENAYYTELYVFEDVFQQKGYDCEVVDIRDLDYKDGKLVSLKTGKVIDVIYRRAVTRDVMEHYEQVQPFIQAYLHHDVCCIGAFQTQLVHHKQITQVLMDPVMQKYFSPDEVSFIEKHCPITYDLTQDVVKKIQDKDHWIIKPKDSYASKGVWAGIDLHQDQWNQVVSQHLDANYIVQKYITPYKTKNIDLVNFDEFKDYSNMSGLYVYNGHFAGVYSRCSDGGIISTQYNEKTIPTLFLR